MRGRRLPFEDQDAGHSQPLAARRRVPADLPSSEPVAVPYQLSSVYPAAFGMSGSVAAAAEIAEGVVRGRAAGIQQPPQPWLQAGLQDPPLPLRLSGAQAPPAAVEGESLPTGAQSA